MKSIFLGQVNEPNSNLCKSSLLCVDCEIRGPHFLKIIMVGKAKSKNPIPKVTNLHEPKIFQRLESYT